ncbi:MAG: hypothetical protein WB554_12120, partial [Desulfomonilaceae bacterium]
MIILDEQLDPTLVNPIKKWHKGKVDCIHTLDPKLPIVKDDRIPQILSQTNNNPTFVTINVRDFWKKIPINNRFSVVCFYISDLKTEIIPNFLRVLFRNPKFKTKRQRAGYVFR